MTKNTTNYASEWHPLEADPQVWNSIIHESGVSNEWHFVSLQDGVENLPAEALALVYVFPRSDEYESYKQKEVLRLAKMEQCISPNVIFFQQAHHNNCGMMALLHALANNDDKEIIGPGTMHSFFEQAKGMSPDERKKWLKKSDELRHLHQTAALLQKQQPGRQDGNHHYVCFVEVDDHLYELDSQFSLPINHGRLASSLAQCAQKYIEKYISFASSSAEDTTLLALISS
ncbi:cysteine proteinase [Hesseltinella vesiculosa]|uniref:Ubiquitin carboxyl-terminal hydrolase n=1 Tax=Hesseltinella vesiculosa TaxID=101127 RepID=A0A1X2GSB9_9FUNG|nr:cysteine proteinase [Hesseltinella vesiculosa]